MAEKRKLKRRHLIYYLRVYDQNTDTLVGQLVDITTRGMKLTSEQAIDENQLFKLKMILPDKIEGSQTANFEAQSMWSKKDVNPKYYITGFEFKKISPRDIRRIESLIYEFSFQN